VIHAALEAGEALDWREAHALRAPLVHLLAALLAASPAACRWAAAAAAGGGCSWCARRYLCLCLCLCGCPG
jgi:hypothetical protein